MSDTPTTTIPPVPTTIEVALAERGYPVTVGQGVLAQVAQLGHPPSRARRALVVSQEPIVRAGHVAPVEASLRAAGLEVATELVPDGEGAKDVTVLARLWDACAAVPLSRGDLLVAVGGGVVTDLTGFAAASYNRGIAVLQVPTTLLAQVDAAIGGKTGINLAAGKNLVGAFHQPCGVVCDVDVLATLPRRLFVEGLGEVVKAGLLADPAVLELLESAPLDPSLPLLGLTPAQVRELVERSVAVKAEVVAGDEREGGARAHLNLGHTYGHAVETLTGYGTILHGEAVAIGTVVALELGRRLGRTPAALVERAVAVLRRVGLPVHGPELSRQAVWEVLARDKKAAADGVRFVVLDGLARPTVVRPEAADVDAVLDQLASSPPQGAS